MTEYIYFQLKERILAGILSPDEKLPSKRSLASHLGVSVITVEHAYQQLIDEGYVYSAEKRGYFVTELENFLPKHESDFSADKKEGPQEKAPDSAAEPKDSIINLRDTHIHRELFPFSLWSSLMRKVLQESKDRILSPLPSCGLLELRQAIASYLGTFRNMQVEPEQVVVGAGSEYLYSLALQLLGKNLRYGVENPGYLKPARIMDALQVQWLPMDMDEAGIRPAELEEKDIDVALVSPAHHFPTGIIMPIKRRQELLAWARARGHRKSRAEEEAAHRLIIEDDYDSEFRFTGRPLETLFSLDSASGHGQARGKVVYMNTFTKTLTPSLRVSYMVLPKNLVEKFHRELGFYSCTVSSMEQLTLARFIQEGHYEKHLARRKNHYRNVRDTLLSHLIRSPLSPRMTITGKDSGLHFLLKVTPAEFQHGDSRSENRGENPGENCGKNRAEPAAPPEPVSFRRLLEQAGIQVAFLSQFYHQQKGCHQDAARTLVVSYSALKKEQIPQLVDGLCTAFG